MIEILCVLYVLLGSESSFVTEAFAADLMMFSTFIIKKINILNANYSYNTLFYHILFLSIMLDV